jgi:hypothetical protein
VINKGEKGMELSRRKSSRHQWNFPTAMEYAYPKLEFDVGTPFAKGPNWQNPERDPWMKEHLDKQGMATPRRFLSQED